MLHSKVRNLLLGVVHIQQYLMPNTEFPKNVVKSFKLSLIQVTNFNNYIQHGSKDRIFELIKTTNRMGSPEVWVRLHPPSSYISQTLILLNTILYSNSTWMTRRHFSLLNKGTERATS